MYVELPSQQNSVHRLEVKFVIEQFSSQSLRDWTGGVVYRLFLGLTKATKPIIIFELQ